MTITESGEMYLETILVLSTQKNLVRSIDIAGKMGFSKPSVSRAMRRLHDQQYILIDRDGYIALTEKGRAIAERIYERHTLLTELLTRLGVDSDTAAKDACKIEHVISAETFEAIKAHLKQYGNPNSCAGD